MDSDSTSGAPENAEKMEVFIELLTHHDQALNAYVMTLVASASDAQDILQETKIALWRSFESFEPGTNFGAWARKAALNRILDYRKRKGRENDRVWFSEECYEKLAEDFEPNAEVREARNHHLRECITKLQAPHREILTLRYFRDTSIEDVAARVGRTVDATYRVLSRIRLALRKCLTNPAKV
ncbi:MAG: sigma-70 family RNA polymerase sigma factor [Verrucomicrobiales bacterium]|nr:sigma-70 family RNA polymerase sigma factor [Verrucomicrobiales bacterium]